MFRISIVSEKVEKKKGFRTVFQSRFTDEGKGILITMYAIDLYFISIPLKVKNIIHFNSIYVGVAV